MKENQLVIKWKKVKSNNRLGWFAFIDLPKHVDHKTLTVWKLFKEEVTPIRPYHNHNVHILHIGHDLSLKPSQNQLVTSSDGLYDDLLLIEWGNDVPLRCKFCKKEIPDDALMNFCIYCGESISS